MGSPQIRQMDNLFLNNYKGARGAVGMGALPSNIAVEIEAIFEVRG